MNTMEDNRERYKVVCSECENTFYACKSIAQECGMLNSGCGSCPKCKTFLNLTYDEKSNEMKSVNWNDFLKNN